MKRITVGDRRQIKQLLYGEGVLGVKDDTCPAFDGFELWWYDKRHDICRCCRSRWSDLKRQVEGHSLDARGRDPLAEPKRPVPPRPPPVRGS